MMRKQLRMAGAACALVLGTVGCGQDKSSADDGASWKARAALGEAAGSVTLPWGDEGLGYKPAVTEGAALGVPAVAIGRAGLYLLDALHGRVVRVSGTTLTKVATVPVDSDDLAIGPDGAIAVKRSVKQEVLVFAPDGTPAGRVDTSAVEALAGISLGRSRQVFAQNGFQETFAFGSPSFPQVLGQVVAGKREGADFLPTGEGLVAVRTDAGDLELRTTAPFGREGVTRRAPLNRTVVLGKGDGARVVGTTGSLACTKLESVSQDASGALTTKREAACVDVEAGSVVFRTALPAPGVYVPKRELAFGNGIMAFVRPTEAGLEVQTWKLAGGAR